jgi:hypothetical protein
MTRELARASSSPVRRDRGSAEQSSAGVHRDTKAPTGKASTARSIQVEKKCGEHRYDATSRMAKARRTDARHS